MDESLGSDPFRGPEVYLGDGAYICVPLFRLFVVVVFVCLFFCLFVCLFFCFLFFVVVFFFFVVVVLLK